MSADRVAHYRRVLRDWQARLAEVRLREVQLVDQAEIAVKIALDDLWWAQGNKDAW